MSEDNLKAIEIRVKGRVQGVFFRASTKEVACSLNINGWVKNEFTGDVLIYAEGLESQIMKLIEWCNKGPEFSNVTDVSFKWLDSSKGFTSFEIAY